MDWLTSLFQNEVFQTIITGVIVFIIAQILQNFALRPIYLYKRTIGKIDNRLKFYSQITGNPGSEYIPRYEKIECFKVLRNLSCELEANFKQIPFRWYFSKDDILKVADSASRLIRLSNNIFTTPDIAGAALNNYDDEQIIRKNLNIPRLS